VVGCCECGNETWGSVKCKEFVWHCQEVLKKGCVLWSQILFPSNWAQTAAEW
jgi:hypothetical protein